MQNVGAASTATHTGSWFSSDAISRIMGFSFLASLFQGVIGFSGSGVGGGHNLYIADSMRLFLLGAIIEVGRKLFGWVVERFKFFQYSVTAHFSEGDPVYEWMVLLLTEEKIWARSRQFRVSATSSLRQWNVNLTTEPQTKRSGGKHAEYVPTYQDPLLFQWRGYLAEVRCEGGPASKTNAGQGLTTGKLALTLYTRNMGALSAMVEDARQRYIKSSRPHVIVHTVEQAIYGPGSVWNNAKQKSRRPLSSIILQEGVISSLLEDAREFIKMEDWYSKVDIPHRRGYLLYGPPGTGKSSTIYAIAGELGLEIYCLSLAASFVDDSFLARAVASIPKQAIFLLEDIDCAFPSREDVDDEDVHRFDRMARPDHPGMRRGSSVTLSGLLNVLDGVGSEEGKIFFATTNHIDRLDPALLRPGRIDKKIRYKLARKAQIAALFLRFYPETYTALRSERDAHTEGIDKSTSLTPSEKQASLQALSEEFAACIPDYEFSTAEVQGFLLGYKQQPELAVECVRRWVEEEQRERSEQTKRKQRLKDEKRADNEAEEVSCPQGGLAQLGVAFGSSLCDSAATGLLPGASVSTPPGQAPAELELQTAFSNNLAPVRSVGSIGSK